MVFSPTKSFFLERKVAIAFGATLFVLLVVMGVAWWNAARFRGTHRGVNQTHEVLGGIEQALSAVAGMESSTRGFVLTADEEILRRYHAGAARLEQVLARTKQQIGPDVEQQQRHAQLTSLARDARDNMAERIAARQGRGLDLAEQAAAIPDAERALDALRVVVDGLALAERRQLEAQLRRARDAGRLTVLTIVAASLVAIGAVALAGSRVRAYLQRRREAEAAVKEELDLFFTLSLDLLSVANFAGYFTRLNPAWERILGFTRDELMARPYIDFVHPDDREGMLALAAALARGEEAPGLENRFRCKDGSYRWLRWSARAAPAGQLIHASARDVTEGRAAARRIHELNTALASRTEQLEAANRALESFSYSVSHDLRAPLRHIDGFAGLLGQHAAATLDQEGRRFLSVISKSAKEMGTLIDELLAFSRIGRARLHFVTVKHEQLVAGIIADGHYDAHGRAIAWEIKPLPDVRADAAMLRQVWANLIDNAVKYSRKAAQSRITVGGREDITAGEYVFFVRDNGVGFDMAFGDKLFGVFQRLHAPAEFEGTGIGLANVRRIVTRHGGRTWAEGYPGEGATFYFSIPFNVPAPAESS